MVTRPGNRATAMRIRLALRQNRGALAFVAAWLLGNATAFALVLHMPRAEALAVAACVTKAQAGWPVLYQSFTQFVVFGLVASMVATNVTRRYRPEETCRALAAESSDHVVVVGLSNLGRRVVELVRHAGKDVVIVEEDAALLATEVRAEAPCVVGSARERGTLVAAGVERAKVVVVATDDLETGAVACRHVRELNPTCELVLRCSDEDVGRVLGAAYRARVVSTSRLAAEFIQAAALAMRARSVVVLGHNTVGLRVAEALAAKRIAHTFVERTLDPEALRAAGVAKADLIVVCDDDLGLNLVLLDRLRDENSRAKIVCRAFHDDAADLLERAPFNCTVISTSRHAAESLGRAGAFREVGIAVTSAPGAALVLSSA